MKNPLRLVLIPLVLLSLVALSYFLIQSPENPGGHPSADNADLHSSATSLNATIPAPGSGPGSSPVTAQTPATPAGDVPVITIPAPGTSGSAPGSAVAPENTPTAVSEFKPAAPATQPAPDAHADTPAAAPMATTPAIVPPTKTYTVKSGDTLSSIAKAQYGAESKWTILAKANPTVDPNRLKVGQVLNIPDAPTSTSSSTNSTTTIPLSTNTTVAPGSHDSTPTVTGGQTYTVQSGDTFWTIAQHFYGDGSKWPTIYNANKKLVNNNPDKLRLGMVLTIPPAPTKSNVPTSAVPGEGNK